MSGDGHAAIGYGFPLPREMTDESKIDLDDLIDDNESYLDFMWSGASYAEQLVTFLIIKESEKSVYVWQGGSLKIDPTKLVIQPDWDQKLNDWATKHKVKKPKINWYLCVSE